MAKAKIAITLEQKAVERLDRLVSKRVFPNRSRAVQAALDEKLERMRHGRLARECAKLDPAFEKAMAEEGLSAELAEWPEY